MKSLLSFTVIASTMFSISAQAGDAPLTLNEWIDQASNAVEGKMEYPETAVVSGDIDSQTFVVTVNKQGDILEITKRVMAKSNYFDKASSRALSQVDFPDLPSSYKADTLSFALVLNYIQNDDDLASLHKADKLPSKHMIARTSEKPTQADKPNGDGY